MLKFRYTALIALTLLVIAVTALVVTGVWEAVFYRGSRNELGGSMMSPAGCA